jgi:hypothetical protein
MLEGISAKTAALFGVVVGLALSATAGFRPNVQFDMKVNFQPPQNKDESVEPISIEQVPLPFEHQPSSGYDHCEACGKG